MAGHASFRLHGGVFKGERTSLVRVAVEAKLILCSRGTQLMGQEPAMRIVTIRTLDQSLIHFVMEGPGKIRFGFQMAAVTKAWLRGAQQLALNLRMVHRVAVNASDIVLDVLRPQKVRVLFPKLMAGKTAPGCLLL
jgi:hypothetical protein